MNSRKVFIVALAFGIFSASLPVAAQQPAKYTSRCRRRQAAPPRRCTMPAVEVAARGMREVKASMPTVMYGRFKISVPISFQSKK